MANKKNDQTFVSNITSWKCRSCKVTFDNVPKIEKGLWGKRSHNFLYFFNRKDWSSRTVFTVCPVCGFKNLIHFENRDYGSDDVVKSLPISFKEFMRR